jgi:hypothetical protein
MRAADADAAPQVSTREYRAGSVRLEVLRATVPLQRAAVDAVLASQFGPRALTEYTLCASDRAAEAVPKRVGAELLCWGRRCDASVSVPSAWLVASGARFVAGNAHRREVLSVLGALWGAQAELAALERELCAADAAADVAAAAAAATAAAGAAAAADAPLWVVDFRRVNGPTGAMTGPIPVCSLDGRTLAVVPASHAALMRARSPRLADALRIGFANHEHWGAHAAQPACVDVEAGGKDADVFREQVAAFVRSPGGVGCKSLVYFLDTFAEDSACAHRPGALASQVYVGIVGSKDGDQVRVFGGKHTCVCTHAVDTYTHTTCAQLVNTLGKRMLQHLAGDELLVDMELQNPALRRYAAPSADDGVDDCEPGPRPAMLVLPLDFGMPGLHGKHSVGLLEGVYMVRFVCVALLLARARLHPA